VRADVQNIGSSGVANLPLYNNRKVLLQQSFPVIRNNIRSIEFEFRLSDPGKQELSVGDSKPITIEVSGERQSLLFNDLTLSEKRILEGDSLAIGALAVNLKPVQVQTKVRLFVDGKETSSQLVM